MRDDDQLELEAEHRTWGRTSSLRARVRALTGLLVTSPLWTYPVYLSLASVTTADRMPDTAPELEICAGVVILVGGPAALAAAPRRSR